MDFADAGKPMSAHPDLLPQIGGHNVDPWIPAPLLGGDDNAMPEGGAGEWVASARAARYSGGTWSSTRETNAQQGIMTDRGPETT